MAVREDGERAGQDDLRAILSRSTPLPLPDPGFDPSTASDEVLDFYGLPSASGPDASSGVRAFRRKFLQPPAAGPLLFVSAMTLPLVPPGTSVPPLSGPWPAQKSANWSGAFVTPMGGRSFISVMGTWTVPAVEEPGGTIKAEYHSSTWIGLDGMRFYRDSSLPQIGTLQKWTRTNSPEQSYEAWFQWWDRGQANFPIPLPAMPVSKGDEISAILTVLSTTKVRFNLKNETQGVMLQAFDRLAPGACTVSGATAEWIMERPSPLGSDGWGAHRLPAYTPSSFTDCIALSKAPNDPASTDHDLERARLIRMYEITSDPTSVGTISLASRTLAPVQALNLAYVGP